MKPKITRVPGNFPTLRATNVFVEFDGGSFLISLQELRAAENYDAAAPIEHLASIEVGRFTISPSTIVWLEQAIAKAKKAYESGMGHPIPDPAKVGDALNAQAAIDSVLNPKPPGDQST